MSDYKQRCEAYLKHQIAPMNSKSMDPKNNKQRVWNQSIVSKNNQPVARNRIPRLCTQQSAAEKDKFKNKESTWDGLLTNVTLIVFFTLCWN